MSASWARPCATSWAWPSSTRCSASRSRASGSKSRSTTIHGPRRSPRSNSQPPPGTYEVSANLQGFVPAKVADVKVELGKQLPVDLNLKLAGVSESVTVTAESPLIDTKASATTASIDSQYIELIPKSRGLRPF